MTPEKMQKWFEAYAAWRKEAQEQAYKIMKDKGYFISDNEKLHVYDDGSIFWEWLHSNGQRNEFHSRWIKDKVTPWKESKYYIEI